MNEIVMTQTVSLFGAAVDFDIKKIDRGLLLIISGSEQRNVFIEGSEEQMDKLCMSLEIALKGRRQNITDLRLEEAVQQLITINAQAQLLKHKVSILSAYHDALTEQCNKIIRFTTLNQGGESVEQTECT